MFLPDPAPAPSGCLTCVYTLATVFTHGVPAPQIRRNTMPEMDTFHATVLEGYWWGLDAYEIAEQLGADPREIAIITDTFRDLGY